MDLVNTYVKWLLVTFYTACLRFIQNAFATFITATWHLDTGLLGDASSLLDLVIIYYLPGCSSWRWRWSWDPASHTSVGVFRFHLAQGLEAGRSVAAPTPRTARDQAEERLAEVVWEERVQDRVDAAVHVRQTVGDHLGDGERQRRVVDRAKELQHEDHLQPTPHINNSTVYQHRSDVFSLDPSSSAHIYPPCDTNLLPRKCSCALLQTPGKSWSGSVFDSPLDYR